jgi:hypothetical protein
MSKRTVEAPSIAPEDDRGAQIAQAVREQMARRVGAPTSQGDDTSVTVQVPGGPLVEMGPPSGGTMRRAIKLMEDMESNSVLMLGHIKAMLYVRSVDGVAVGALNNKTDLQRLGDKLGDRGEEIVMVAYGTYWPSFTEDSLPVVKK